MTCIVGLIAEDGTVYMGGDSAGVGGDYSKTIRVDRKVFVRPPYIFGFTDSFRMGQLIQYGLQLPKPPKNPEHDHKFMVTTFIDAIRKCFKDGGYLKEVNKTEKGGAFLVGFRGKIYQIYDDFQVGIPSDSYAAFGCGEHFALGSLYSTGGPTGLASEIRVRVALEAAAHGSAGVSAPFIIEKLK